MRYAHRHQRDLLGMGTEFYHEPMDELFKTTKKLGLLAIQLNVMYGFDDGIVSQRV